MDNNPLSQPENSQKVYLSVIPAFAAIPAAMIVHGTNHETTSNFSMIFKGVNSLEITTYKEESGLINLAMTISYPINGAPNNIPKISFNMIKPTTSDAMVRNVFIMKIENIRLVIPK